MRRQLGSALRMTIVLIVLLGLVYPVVVFGVSQLLFKHQADGSLKTAGGRVVGSTLIGQQFVLTSGQPDPRYFQPRPSAAGAGYDPMASSGSNLGPSNPLLIGFVPGVNTVDLSGQASPTNPFATAADPDCVPLDAKTGNPVTSPATGEVFAHGPDGMFACDPNTVPERVAAYRLFNRLPAGTAVPVDAVTASGSGLDPDISEANALDQAGRVATTRRLAPALVTALVKAHVDARAWGFLGAPTVNVLDLNLALDAMR